MKTKLKKLKTKIIKKETRNKFNERENSNKQIEEEKEVKSQQEIVQPKIFNYSKRALSRYQINILLRGINSLLHQSAALFN